MGTYLQCTEMGEEAMQCARQLKSRSSLLEGRDESRPICPMPVASVMPRPHSPIGAAEKRGHAKDEQPFKARNQAFVVPLSHQPGS
jgi:hypothetical protein